MTHILRTILTAIFLAGIFSASPALAEKADGKIEIRNSSPKQSVVIRQDGKIYVLHTTPAMAKRIQKMIDRKDSRLTIRNPHYVYSLDDDDRLYYRNRKTSKID